MAWEMALLKRTRLKQYPHCLEMLNTYADLAPVWERCCLVGYVGLGTWLAGRFGLDMAETWQRGETVLNDMLFASEQSPREIAALLRQHVKVRLEKRDHLPFAEAKAGIYDQLFYPVAAHMTYAVQPSAAARREFVEDVIACMTAERARVADLGCGPGMILCDILKMKPLWTGQGLDTSQAAVNYARRLAVQKGVADRANFTTGDIAQLPYASGSIDLVVASEVLEHVPDLMSSLREIARVLRPGGQVAITVPIESRASVHLNTLSGREEARSLCSQAGLSVRRSENRWHLGYGDDRRHMFILAEKGKSKKVKGKGEAETHY